MSQDIRSFFTASRSIGTQKKTFNTQEIGKKFNQRKRAVAVIDSDSEEESNAVKRSKSSSTKEKITVIKNDDKLVSKYFPTVEKVAAGDIFGSRPVKRDNSRNIIKKAVTKEVKEFHLDKDFESELLLLDEVDAKFVPEDFIDCKSDVKLKDETSITNLSPKKVKNAQYNYEAISSPKRRKNIFNDIISPKKKIKPKISGHVCESDTVNHISLEKTKGDKHKTPSPKLFLSDKIYINGSFSSESDKIQSKNNKTDRSSVDESSSKYEKKRCKLNKIEKSPTKTQVEVKQYSPQRKENNTTKSKQNNCTPTKNLQSPKKHVEIKSPTSQNKICSSPNKGKIEPNIKGKTDFPQVSCHLWVEKYKPTTTKQIIGQQGEKSCVNKLTIWLNKWHKNQSGHKTLAKPSPWAKNDDGAYFKAALLSGPPGVGKTTTAHLVCKELGYDVVEFNASDTRSKKLLHEEVSELLSTNSLSPFFTGKDEGVSRKHVLLMDEVDGMAGNEDRGGVQELIQLIRQSRIPIICMCNDRNHPKIRSLSNYCFDLRFSKPRAEQIRGAMMSVCFKEKLKILPNVMTDIIKSANQDIRLIINHLSMLSLETSNLANSSKHIKMGPWDIVRKVFSEEEHKSMSIHDKCDLFFHDYSITPLFVQENYLAAVSHKPEAKNKVKKMEMFAVAARSLSLGDLTEKKIRSSNAWSLLPVEAVFSSLVPGAVLEGHIGAQINFPSWFGKNSRQTKMNRFLQELTTHSRLKISGNKEAMNLDYLTPLEKSIVMPLVELGTGGIPQALSVLSEYSLVREDMESIAELSSWPNSRNQFSEVESKVKAAFTRAYNKSNTPTPYAAVQIKKGSRIDAVSEEGMSQDLEDDEVEEDDSLDVDAMIVLKKKPTSKTSDKEVVPSTSKRIKNGKRGKKK